MKVTLLTSTPEPERVIATAARLCYSADCASMIFHNMYDDGNRSVQIKMLKEIGHESPFEHATFTFAIEDVSRSLLAQITRHRLASFSVRSQRYVKTECAYIVPDEIANDEHTFPDFSEAIDTAHKAYNILTVKLKTKYISNGMDAKSAEKKAIEDARFVLPNAACTSMVMTMNARELLHFFRLRCCNRAQWEIREVADEMLKQCKEVAPTIFENAGAPCVSGKCPEGRMSCGKPRKENNND